MSAPAPSPAAAGPAPAVVRVLHVEDDDAHARLVHEVIAEAGGGFDVTRAGTVADAEAALGRDVFDAVLLDLRLPDGRGVKAFKRVTGAAGPIPVVILSSLADERLAVESVGAGAEDYLVKDRVTPDSLTRALRHAIRRRGRGRTGGEVQAHPSSASPAATVALIGANALVLEALASGLAASPELSLVGTFRDAGELARTADLRPVDLVVEAALVAAPGDLRRIREQLVTAKLVLLADATSSNLRAAILGGEVDGLVLTSGSARQVVGALRVLTGALVLPGGRPSPGGEGLRAASARGALRAPEPDPRAAGRGRLQRRHRGAALRLRQHGQVPHPHALRAARHPQPGAGHTAAVRRSRRVLNGGPTRADRSSNHRGRVQGPPGPTAEGRLDTFGR